MEQYVYTYDSFAQRGAEQYVPTDRFQVKSSVYLPASDIDPRTGQLQPDRHQRRRTQGLNLEREGLDKEGKSLNEALRREFSKGGVRISVRALVLIVAAVLFFCGILLLSQQGMIAERQKALNRLERSIKDYRTQNASLEEEIAQASDASTICYAAARDLNMIPAEAAEAVYLVAVDTRPALTASNDTAQTAETDAVQEAANPSDTIHVSADSGN
ncbi:MAG: hypothetical protein SO010_10080 [Candidatus Limiplasma sp.]|nr:hypothetical protein [Clostridiales bacterium]MDY4063240.1 hypothetical protein [Candidatus Limiplasma sp.]